MLQSLAYTPFRLKGADKRQINDNGLTTRLQAKMSFIESPYGGSNPSPTAKEDKMCSNLKEASSYYTLSPGGGTGRHAGLKILFAVRRVTVRFRSRAHNYSHGMSLFTSEKRKRILHVA